ncbi:MAG: hypothetical protein OJF49_003225 [Ktedonobacterales bacterium]|jgi:hypothetical protein|nr:MAG: hypothetical protein OJF49_003225 [Ktedonobacterales bacterium]
MHTLLNILDIADAIGWLILALLALACVALDIWLFIVRPIARKRASKKGTNQLP